VWAAGYSQSTTGLSVTTITLHWDGSAWTQIPSPNVGRATFLEGILAIASDDVWAVGTSFTATAEHTFAIHWNGTTWAVVPSPSPGLEGNDLASVTSTSSGDVWAVGYFSPGGDVSRVPLAMRWDGQGWTVEHTTARQAQFLSVSASPTGDLWAAGYFEKIEKGTLVARWTGTRWRVVPSESVLPGSNVLAALDVSQGARNAWAAGSVGDLQTGGLTPLIERPVAGLL
jgi:hypothetical protein